MTKVVSAVALMLGVLAFAQSAHAAFPGYAQREYRGRLYLLTDYQYHAPTWYAGDGVVKSRRVKGAAPWPGFAVANSNAGYRPVTD